jgi:hypothetical protein
MKILLTIKTVAFIGLCASTNYALDTTVEVPQPERDMMASKLNSECAAKLGVALQRRDDIVKMKRPSGLSLSDTGRQKAHYDHKDIHLKAYDDMAAQASQWINSNKQLVLNEIKRQYFDIARTKYARECQTNIDNLNGFVDWTILGTKNPTNLIIYMDAVKKAAKGAALGDEY